MKKLYKNLHIYDGQHNKNGGDGGFVFGDILTCNGVIAGIFPAGSEHSLSSSDGHIGDRTGDCTVISFSSSDNIYAFPGFVDVHTHLREPGFSYKETVKTGTLAAARGGYTEIFAMPNVSPAPDCTDNLKLMTDIIRRDAAIGCTPYGTITKARAGRELSDMRALAPHVIAFSDDGDGISDDGVMRLAMTTSRRLNKIIAAHCEDKALAAGGSVHDGEYTAALGVGGIPSESEWRQIERDLALAAETGCSYHVCHVSCRESVELIRRAKAAGIDVSCETAPHYLTLTDADVTDLGKWKMNPPLRSRRDREELILGICDGTVDMIATDHAPHTYAEKSRGLAGSPFGISGLECAFPVLYTRLVRTKIITLQKLIRLMHDAPSARFGVGSPITVGAPASFTVFDLGAEYKIDSGNFISLGKSTPFDGDDVYGRCLYTVYRDSAVWETPYVTRT